MMDKELIDFLIEAKKQTYANENVKKKQNHQEKVLSIIIMKMVK